MTIELFEAYYEKRGFDQPTTQKAIRAVDQFEKAHISLSKTLETVTLDDVRAYIKASVIEKETDLEDLLALARYFYLIDRQDIYIYFTALLGGHGVIENITKRMAAVLGQETTDHIFEGIIMLELGSEPADMPPFTARLMNRLESLLTPEMVQKVLAGNNHDIPKEVFIEERAIYQASESLDAYLVDYQKRKIQELQDHCDQNKIWCEQKITQAVVDFAASNQEIMSAVREGNTLYVTKIPYDPDQYLKAQDPKLKRYYACHCPFVRESILSGNPVVSANWCYCSGGFAKFPYEVIFDRELRVELLQSALKGDPICRFAVHLD